jgi:alpha-tubulin suppressor-like RCC1 family protein
MPMLDWLSRPVADIASVAVGNTVACALRTNGHVTCAGGASLLGDGTMFARSTLGGDVSFLDDAVALSAGDRHVCALRATNQISCWGENNDGQLSVSTPNIARAPLAVAGTYTAVAAGDTHTCGLREDGAVVCWGGNQFGQIGNGTATTLEPPTVVSGITDAVGIETGARSTYALRSSGGVSGWGWNFHGQLGNNMVADISPVVDAMLFEGVRSITSRTSGHACAQNTTRTVVYCWGYNAWSQLGDGTTENRAAPVAVIGLP